MARTKATPRTLLFLRTLGWNYWPVERYNAFSGRKTDLFNIIDYLVITSRSTIGIQSCAGDYAAHVKKITEEEIDQTVAWLTDPNRKLFLIGWRKVLRVRGGKQRIYKPRIGVFYLDGSHLAYQEKNTDRYGR